MEVDHRIRVSGGDGETTTGQAGVVGVFFAGCWLRLRSVLVGLCCWVAGFARKVGRIAREDPRRVAHSFKVGLALTLVSVLYYVTPLFKGFGVSTLWAVLTVVVVMEYTVGGTLSKGLNRAFATFVAGFIAVGAHQVANRCGAQGEPILLAIFVFLLASAATFSRFIPEIKARYDYGVTIFILTFSLVAVSSYRVEELIQLAHQRFSTIVIGVLTCLCTTIFVFPVWAGEDLHKLTAGNLDKLAQFLQGLESECFGEKAASENLEGKAFLQVYKSVLNSKASEDSLCNFAKWEPGHGKFGFRHPWSQYQKLGALCRQCASSMEALASYVITLQKSQYPEANPELTLKVRTACGEMSSHSAKALKELSTAIRTMIVPCPANIAMSAAIKAAKDLRNELSEEAALLQVMHVAVTATLLSDLVTTIVKIAETADNLARLGHFKKPEKTQKDVAINIPSR
ncbi:aluminum-activated malate transporter 1-like isoform X2 [Triticum urartu]|uniref:Aluminum-activated malate transporter 1 n=1 Tax=Triticum urartu TaxID=4572 RepID=A0A8R7PFI6_TRIUA|nr:aluminum-activated malate transporter 1-like [Triticum dicoccoides]XP_048561024.1 aluminum-activated malate transporter 1-like isoform X2 [Triticum urartu]